MESELMVVDYKDSKTLTLLKNTVAFGTSDQEFDLFCRMAQSTGLNPIKKEIWCIVTGKGDYRRVQMMTGINGFYAIANSHPQYDGMELEYGNLVDIPLPPNADGVKSIKAPEWVDCKTYRKDRRFPQVARAYWHEYAKDLVSKGYQDKLGKLGIWAKMSSVMLAKCAESMSLRKSFPQELNGLYSQEEMPSDFKLQTPQASVVQEVPQPNPKPQKVEAVEVEDDLPDFGECVYDLSSFYENEARADLIEKYIETLKASAVKFSVDMNALTLTADRDLPKLQNYKIQ